MTTRPHRSFTPTCPEVGECVAIFVQISTQVSTQVATYRNAMEPLVIQEVELQMQNLSPEVAESIDKADAIAYALNHLPSMYATTEEGWQWHQNRAKKSLSSLILGAVSLGITRAQHLNR